MALSFFGLGLLSGYFLRITLLLIGLQMVGAVSPIFLFPGRIFISFPHAPTMEGQYIIKSQVLISAAIVIGATVRGGKVIADSKSAQATRKIEEIQLKRKEKLLIDT